MYDTSHIASGLDNFQRESLIRITSQCSSVPV